jgi:cell surface protein SprA
MSKPLSLTVCNLEDGKARAAFKNTELDVRSYKKLKMFVHACGIISNTANPF